MNCCCVAGRGVVGELCWAKGSVRVLLWRRDDVVDCCLLLLNGESFGFLSDEGAVLGLLKLLCAVLCFDSSTRIQLLPFLFGLTCILLYLFKFFFTER